MTNEEIKKKIVEILNDVTTEPMIYKGRYLGDTQIPELKINAIADVLIAAGLTFDKTTAILDERTNGKTLILKAQYYDQMKHRAEVAERALKIAEDLGELCAPAEDYIEQAEKELAEEGKND